MVDGPDNDKSPRSLSCMIPSRSAFTIQNHGCKSPMDGRDLRPVHSDDSSVFSGLDSARNHPVMNGRISKKCHTSHNGIGNVSYDHEGRTHRHSPRKRQLQQHIPPHKVMNDRFDAIAASDSSESTGSLRGFFRSLPAVADRDSYLSSSSSGSVSESASSHDMEFIDRGSYGGSMGEMHSDSSSLAFLTEIPVASASSEERIAAMLAEHETRMNQDLEVIHEIASIDNNMSSSDSSHASGICRRVRSEDDRKYSGQSHVVKMQRVLQKARQEVEVLKDNNEQFMSEIEQTEEEHRSNMKLYEDRTKHKLAELRSMYLSEIDLVSKEKDGAIVEASRQSALFAEAGRKKIASLKRQLKKAQDANATIVYEAMSTVSSASKRQRGHEVSEDTAKIRHEYESKFKKFKADSASQLKLAIEKGVNHNTKRILKEKNKEMADSISLIKQRVERDSNLERKAFNERYGRVSSLLEEAKKKIETYQGEREVITQILAMVKENLVSHNEEKIKLFLERQQRQQQHEDDDKSVVSVLKYEKSVSKYHDIIGKSFVTEMGTAMQEVLTMYAYLLQSAEDSQRTSELRSQTDHEKAMRVTENLNRQLQESASRIAKLESEIKKESSNRVELEKLRSEREAMHKMEKGRKELAVAMAAGQLELAYTMAAGRDDIVSAMSAGAGEAMVPSAESFGNLSVQRIRSSIGSAPPSPSTPLISKNLSLKSMIAKNSPSAPSSAEVKSLNRPPSEVSCSETSAASPHRRPTSERFRSRSRSLSRKRSESPSEAEPYDCVEKESSTKSGRGKLPSKSNSFHKRSASSPPVHFHESASELAHSLSNSSGLSSSSDKGSFRSAPFTKFKNTVRQSTESGNEDARDTDTRPKPSAPRPRGMRDYLDTPDCSIDKDPSRQSMTDGSASSLMVESGVSPPPEVPTVVSVPQDDSRDDIESVVKRQNPFSNVGKGKSPACRPVLESSTISNRVAPVAQAKAGQAKATGTQNRPVPNAQTTKNAVMAKPSLTDASAKTKRKSSLTMFANKRKPSSCHDALVSTVSKERQDPKKDPDSNQHENLQVSSSDVSNTSRSESSASPTKKGSRTIKLRKPWMYGKKKQPDDNSPHPKIDEGESKTKDLPRKEMSPPRASADQKQLPNTDEGLKDVPPLKSRQILTKRKPVIVDGKPQAPSDVVQCKDTEHESNEGEPTGPPRRNAFNISTAFNSVKARRKQPMTPAATGHTLFLHPLAVSRPQPGAKGNELHHHEMRRNHSWNSFESESPSVPPSATSVSEECESATEDFDLCDSASQLRDQAGYPSLGDKSDDEEDNEAADADDDDTSAESVDKYATFSPVQFSDKRAKYEQTGSLRGKRVTASGVRGLPSMPDLDERSSASPQKNQQFLESPETPKRRDVFSRIGRPSSAFSPTTSEPPSPASSHGSSEATTTITSHTQRSTFRSFSSNRSSLLPPRGNKIGRNSSNGTMSTISSAATKRSSTGFGKLRRKVPARNTA